MKHLTDEEAVKFKAEDAWRMMTQEEIFNFQINQSCLCVPFGIFHEATEVTLGRTVFIYEFFKPEKLIEEYNKTI